MADNLTIEVKSNTDSLSARAVHDCFVNLVQTEIEGGEVFLKALVPKREGDLFAHAGHKGPIDGGLIVEGSVGIPEIHKQGESSLESGKYPLDVDQGTGIFGDHGTIFPREKRFMYIPPERGIPGFLAHSKGQRGRGFMAATYALMVASLQINGQKFRAELTARLKADQLT